MFIESNFKVMLVNKLVKFEQLAPVYMLAEGKKGQRMKFWYLSNTVKPVKNARS